MNPTYFGPTERQLFGVYHPPRGAPRDVGVVLCNPAPQEYMRTHWAMRRLATLLAQRSFHVLRFDYYGTGDSAGDGTEGALDTWRNDIGLAAAELKDMSGAGQVSAVGLRLGATLAAQASAAGLGLRDLVLWEPVVHGEPYVAELRAIATRKFSRLMDHAGERPDELMGYPFPETLANATRAIDLTQAAPSARRTVLVSSASSPEQQKLVDAWATAGVTVKRAEVRDEAAAGGMQREAALLSMAALQAIVRACEEQ